MTIDPKVRDLLVAVHTALGAAEVADYPVCAAQNAIRSMVLYGNPISDWLLGETAELADTRRVRSADRWDAYQDQGRVR